jgi:2-polyprenyl-6-methoxyphenol hydroxylase-like FAD-dependent oxidoreductase
MWGALHGGAKTSTRVLSDPTREAKSGILIVGSGLAGLTLALALARRGVLSTVIEKQEKISPSKWTILLYPQGMKVFEELGVLAEVTAQGLKLKAPRIETKEKEVLADLDTGMLFENHLNYYLGMGPSEIRQVLKEHAASLGVEILEGVNYKGLIRSTNVERTVRGALATEDGAEYSISSHVLVGADGYKSKVRADLGPRVRSKDHEALVGFFVDYPHDEDRFRMVLCDGYYVVVYPWTGTRLSIGFGERGLTESSLAGKGGVEYAKKKVLDALPSLSAAVREKRAQIMEDSGYVISPQEVRTSQWAFDGGVLIGDAAHSLHPGTGQGAQQAFVDAMKLAPIIESCLKTEDFSRESLAGFEAARMPLIRLAESTSQRVLSMETAGGGLSAWFRNRYFRKTNQLLAHRWFQEVLAGIRVPSRVETIKILVSLLT